MQIVACQPDIVWERRGENHQKVVRMLQGWGKLQRGALIVLPEMFSTGYSMNVRATLEGQPGADEAFLAELARSNGACVLAGVAARDGDGTGRNLAVAVGPDGAELARYAKLHPTSFMGEPKHYAAGNDVKLFRWGELAAAPFICYDLRFPEIFRRAAGRGAELLVVIASWPVARHEHWRPLLQARAIENQAFVVGVNRCGQDPQFAYAGGSVILGPDGHTLAEAGADECVLAADVDPRAARAYRDRLPFLRDRRREFLGPE